MEGSPDDATGAVPGLSGGDANVADLSAGLRDEIAQATRTVIGVSQATQSARLVDAVMMSSRDGQRMTAAGWPMG